MSTSVAIVIESLEGGGAQHVATTLANAWADEDISVTVVTFKGSETDVFRLDPRIQRKVVGGASASSGPLSALAANMRRVWRIRAALRRSGAGVVIGFVGSTNILTILASQGLRFRLIVSERNDPVLQSIGRVWDFLRRLLYRHADLVIANSRSAVAAMQAYVPAERLMWLPNPLRSPPAANRQAAPWVDTPFLLTVGRLSPAKGHDVLLEAFVRVHAIRPNVHLAILGDGPMRVALETQARAMDIGDHVHFAGYVDDPFPWYRASVALVHPARFEGLPNAVIEAMSVGLAVIATDTQSGLREFVRNGESGLIVISDEPTSLAEAMVRLMDDPALRLRLGEAGRLAVEPCQADKAVKAWTSAAGLTRANQARKIDVTD